MGTNSAEDQDRAAAARKIPYRPIPNTRPDPDPGLPVRGSHLHRHPLPGSLPTHCNASEPAHRNRNDRRSLPVQLPARAAPDPGTAAGGSRAAAHRSRDFRVLAGPPLVEGNHPGTSRTPAGIARTGGCWARSTRP